jgi:WhiB family redox-sensing transcriptional regulator
VRDERWKEDAACKGKPQEWFFKPWRSSNYWEARMTCGRCPVRRECLDFAITNRIDEGFFGGLAPEQRLVLAGRKKKRYSQ